MQAWTPNFRLLWSEREHFIIFNLKTPDQELGFLITSAHLTLFYFMEFCNEATILWIEWILSFSNIEFGEKRLWASRIQHRINKEAHEMWHMMSKHEASLNVRRRGNGSSLMGYAGRAYFWIHDVNMHLLVMETWPYHITGWWKQMIKKQK